MKRNVRNVPLQEDMNLRKYSSSKMNREPEKNEQNVNDVIKNNKNKNLKSNDLHEEQLKLIIQDVKLQRIRDNIKKLETESLRCMNEQLSALVDGVLGDLDRFHDNKDDRLFDREIINERIKDRNNVQKFISRASLLSELLEVRHVRSLYHLFIAGLIMALASGILGDTLSGGWRSVYLGMWHVPAAFQSFNRALAIWVGMFAATCSVHPLFVFWARRRHSLTNAGSWMRWWWDRLWILAFLIGIAIYIVSVVLLLGPSMGPASAAFVLCEQTRLLMKMHSFVRTNAPHFLNTNSTSTLTLPPFSHYLYFLFVPTLIYRDQYPYTSHIRWNFVASCLMEFLSGILMLSCIFKLSFLPEFNSFGVKPQTPASLAATIFRMVLPASVFLLCGFYLFLHAWMNVWAEVLQFADRRFYGDWWNASSYDEYYRTWNNIVHGYLRTYIYQDVHALTGSKFAGKWTVFAISALVHEWIMTFMLGFCYPIMFVQFIGLGSTLSIVQSTAVKGRYANILFWCSLTGGIGFLISLYSMEAFARINCPKENQQFADYFIPRSWTCNGLRNT